MSGQSPGKTTSFIPICNVFYRIALIDLSMANTAGFEQDLFLLYLFRFGRALSQLLFLNGMNSL